MCYWITSDKFLLKNFASIFIRSVLFFGATFSTLRINDTLHKTCHFTHALEVWLALGLYELGRCILGLMLLQALSPAVIFPLFSVLSSLFRLNIFTTFKFGKLYFSRKLPISSRFSKVLSLIWV